MKKICMRMLCVFVIAFACGFALGESERKLTVMVYMCGSNLESEYGAAGSDLTEMLEAGLADRDISVLVMTGGASFWTTGDNAGEAVIREIGKRGMRIVERKASMNMGASATLTGFLQYGVRQYPAKEYALILWNHGGGPLEGVCWDEVFLSDNLQIGELSQALENARLPQKLSWIGFDACLMSTLEIACALSPYADYMIASQEMEPAFGWNYGFLNELSGDADGAECGKIIVDAYFEKRGNETQTMTLSCLDLSQAEAAAKAVSDFFMPYLDGGSSETYSALSGARMNAAGFGKAAYGYSETGYDLVDILDFTRIISGAEDKGKKVEEALNALVVYNRANIENACGVSVYHPYRNKTKFSETWKEEYARIAITPEYSRYVRAFGEWLTGEAEVRWNALLPYEDGVNENGETVISLRLNPEQAREFASAQMLVFRQNVFGDNTYSLIASVPAVMNDGVISAPKAWDSLYIEDAYGEKIGPISFELTQELDIVRPLEFDRVGARWLEDSISTLYYLRKGEDGEALVTMVRVYDEVTGVFTSRIALDGKQTETINVIEYDYVLPAENEYGVLPGVDQWERGSGRIMIETISAEEGWRFLFSEEVNTSKKLFVVFNITDMQQNTYASAPLEVYLTDRIGIDRVEGSSAYEGIQAAFSGYISTQEGLEGVSMDFEITNQSGMRAEYKLEEIVLNDTHCVLDLQYPRPSRMPLDNNETGVINTYLPAYEFGFLDKVDSVRIGIRVYPDANSYKSEYAEVLFENTVMPVSSVFPGIPVLAQGETERVCAKLMNIERSPTNDFSLRVFIENKSDEALSLSGRAWINGLAAGNQYMYGTLPGNTSGILKILVYEKASFNDIVNGFEVSGFEGLYNIILSDRIFESYGAEAFTEITLCFADEYARNDDAESLTMRFEKPYVPEAPHNLAGDLLYIEHYFMKEEDLIETEAFLTLVSNEQFTVKLERALVGNNNITLCLHILGHAPGAQRISFSDLFINDTYYAYAMGDLDDAVIAENTVTVGTISFGGSMFDAPPEGEFLEKFGFTISGAAGCTETVAVYPQTEISLNPAGGRILKSTELADAPQ